MNINCIFLDLINLLPSYKNYHNVKIDKILGGISNLIYKVSADNQKPILIRYYGKQMDNLISRYQEIKIFKLISKNNLGPKLIKLFDKGRIEQFIDSETLTEKNIQLFQKEIITKIKQINKINYKGNLLCWERLINWDNLIIDFDFSKDIQYLKDILIEYPKSNFLVREVFCHNDLLPSNILLDKNNNIHIIDYEYAGINYLGFEISNHLIYYNFENRISNLEIIEFLQMFKNDIVSDLDLEIINFFIDLTYFTWMLWGIISKNNSNIDFDFNKYINTCKKNIKKLNINF